MIARVHSSILQGIDAIACEVEAEVVESADSETKLPGKMSVLGSACGHGSRQDRVRRPTFVPTRLPRQDRRDEWHVRREESTSPAENGTAGVKGA